MRFPFGPFVNFMDSRWLCDYTRQSQIAFNLENFEQLNSLSFNIYY